MPNLILDLLVDRVDLVDEGANSAAFIKLYKRKETEEPMELKDILAKMKPEHASVIEDAISKAKAVVPEEVTKQISDLESTNVDLSTELQKAKDALNEVEVNKSKGAQPDFEEVIKSLDPAVQSVFKSLKEQKELAEQVARDAADKAATEEAITKAKELKAIPVEEAKLVDVVKGISPEVFEILKAANQAIVDGGMFEEVGKSKDKASAKSTTADEAWDKIEKAAAKVSEEQKISKAKAITVAVKENPELYREYLKGGAN